MYQEMMVAWWEDLLSFKCCCVPSRCYSHPCLPGPHCLLVFPVIIALPIDEHCRAARLHRILHPNYHYHPPPWLLQLNEQG
jgi:hypothetical protein